MLAHTSQQHPAPELIANLREQPALTLYRDGLANLNGEATRLLKQGLRHLMLLPPAPTRPRWTLVPAIDGLGLDINLVGWAATDRHLRFRSAGLAVALFAALPSQTASMRLVLEPHGTGWNLVAR